MADSRTMPGEEGASEDTEKLPVINYFDAFTTLVFLYRTGFSIQSRIIYLPSMDKRKVLESRPNRLATSHEISPPS
jgi:hypothetical protein